MKSSDFLHSKVKQKSICRWKKG